MVVRRPPPSSADSRPRAGAGARGYHRRGSLTRMQTDLDRLRRRLGGRQPPLLSTVIDSPRPRPAAAGEARRAHPGRACCSTSPHGAPPIGVPHGSLRRSCAEDGETGRARSVWSDAADYFAPSAIPDLQAVTGLGSDSQLQASSTTSCRPTSSRPLPRSAAATPWSGRRSPDLWQTDWLSWFQLTKAIEHMTAGPPDLRRAYPAKRNHDAGRPVATRPVEQLSGGSAARPGSSRSTEDRESSSHGHRRGNDGCLTAEPLPC